MHIKHLFLIVCLSSTPIISFSQNTVSDSDTVDASFPGGLPAWKKYLEQNLNAIIPVDNGAPGGLYTVNVKFIVARDGSVSDIAPLTKLGYGMEQEVVRIIKKSGAWEPGTIDGKPINIYHLQPVTFVVILDGMEITTNVPYKLFTGVDNPIHISVDKVKPKDLSVTITNGRITPLEDGNFKVKVNDTTRRAVITVYNAKKGNKEIGAESFEVRPQSEVGAAKKD